MRILFLSAALRYVDTSASNRNRALVSALAQYGHVYSLEWAGIDVAPVCDLPIHAEAVIRVSGFRVPSPGSTRQPHRPVRRLVQRWARHLIRDRLFSFDSVPEVRKRIVRFGTKFDLIITSSDPIGVHLQCIRAHVSRDFTTPRSEYWQYWGDPLFGNVHHPRVPWDRWIERYILSNATRVFYASESTTSVKRTEHASLRAPMAYLPRVIAVPTDLPPMVHARLSPPVHYVYMGDFDAHNRDIMPLLRAMERLPECTLTIAGTGRVDPAHVPPNVRILGRIGKERADALIRDATVAFVIANRTGTQVPGKIFDLALSSAAIIVLHEEPQRRPQFPFAARVLHLRNDTEAIISVLQQPEIVQQHALEEYGRGAEELRRAMRVAFA